MTAILVYPSPEFCAIFVIQALGKLAYASALNCSSCAWQYLTAS